MQTRTILGIESSCDETAAAVVSEKGEILAEVIASQVAQHAAFGGVVPELASRAHLDALTPLLATLGHELKTNHGQELRDVDLIAATQGPGLVGSLVVGFQAAKTLAWVWKKDFVGVDHLTGHLHAPFLGTEEKPDFPLIALLVSGGHSALYLMGGFGEIELLGQTRDDAAGECFDKVAKLLGLGYPGGPKIDKLAAQGEITHSFPPPMPEKRNPNFSFSGLKTAVARYVQKEGMPEDKQTLSNICASFQEAVVRVLVKKSLAACTVHDVKNLCITGGVAANRGLRGYAKIQCEKHNVHLFIPPFRACTDNAAMIALAGLSAHDANQRTDKVLAQVYSRDPRRTRGKFGSDGKHIPRKSK